MAVCVCACVRAPTTWIDSGKVIPHHSKEEYFCPFIHLSVLSHLSEDTRTFQDKTGDVMAPSWASSTGSCWAVASPGFVK